MVQLSAVGMQYKLFPLHDDFGYMSACQSVESYIYIYVHSVNCMHGSLSDIDQHALHVNDTVYIYWTLKNAKNLSVKENLFCIHIIITRMHGPARSICLPNCNGPGIHERQ